MIKALKTIVINMIKRGVVTKASEDDGFHSKAIISYLDKENVISEVLFPYGYFGNLPEGTPVLVFSVMGKDNNRICMGYSQDERKKDNEPSEVGMGNPKAQTFIKFLENGNIEIESTADITIKANNVAVDATKVDLGTGGQKIARKGDPVQVNTGTGLGTITDGGTNTSI